jgi:hypothetical protein
MSIVKLDWSKNRNEPLSNEVVRNYNTVEQYLSAKPQSRQYMRNHETLKSTASVVRFTLQKEVPKVEAEILDRVLFAAFLSNMSDIIITGKEITYIPKHVGIPLEGDTTNFCHFLTKFIPSMGVDWNGNATSIMFRSYRSGFPSLSLYSDILTESSELKGIYSLSRTTDNEITFKSFTNRKDMYQAIFDKGLAALPGTVPKPVLMNLEKEISDAKDAIYAVKGMCRTSSYRRKMVSLLRRLCRTYRWKGDESLRKDIQELAM